MSCADFVHLRVHTAYSLSEGAVRIKELAGLCRQHAMPAVAMTDSGNMFGALEFSLTMSEQGVQPIVGLQLPLGRDDRDAGAVAGGEWNGGRRGRRPSPDPIVLLAQNEAGYGSLLKLTSKAHLETPAGETPHVDLGALAAHGEGVIALTGGADGPVGRLLAEGQHDAAEALLLRLAAIYRGRLYVELQRHGLEIEDRVEPELVDLAYKHDLPLVATNEVFFADASLYEAHDALLCIADGAHVSRTDRRRLTPEHRFKSAAEMRELFADLPEAVDNTLTVARRCAYKAPVRKPILPKFDTGGERDEAEELRTRAAAGLARRLEQHVYAADMDAADREAAAAPYRERLDYELGVIIDMDFPGYFLIVADFIGFARDRGIPVGPGRGSGAGSVVAWSLGITDLDPLRFGLLFERFLNPDRVSMPDFDIDFCQERRDEVIRYVQDKYGRDQVAQIITFGTLQARAALRDVGRVLEMPYGQVDRICKMVPSNPANPVTLARAIEAEPRLAEARDDDPRVARMLDIALKLEGLYRHASTHAAGVVIGDRPLDELIPLYRDPRSAMPVTQFSMKYVEMAGLVKFDFLGLKTLTVIDQALRLLEDRGGARIDIGALPLDDARTYDMLARGETVGVFQFESSGMRDLLREARPTNIEDLIALVALFRPGPMENIPKYIACKHGRERPEFLHETIEPVVADTYGVIIYQEQVMRIAQVFAGYSMAQADLLRRAMGKKIKSEMQAQRDSFVRGAMAKGVARDRAEYVFDLVDKFAGYGFNKAHSAGYALIAYQTAWLKANHPVEFLAACMTLDLDHTDKINLFRQELDRQGIPLKGPDINRSGAEFTVEAGEEGGGAIRYALAAIKNVGREAMRSVVAERKRNGPYRSLFDFARRLDSSVVNKRQLENLARAGAFDSLNPNRAQVLAAVESMVRHASASTAERASNQVSMFAGDGQLEDDEPALPDTPPWSSMEQLRQEFDALGFYLSAHPLDAFASSLKRLRATTYAEIAGTRGDGPGRDGLFTLAGTVLGKKERRSARGSPYAFVQLSDASGAYEITVFSEQLASCRDLLEPGTSLLLTVESRIDGEAVRLTAQKVESLEAAARRVSTAVKVFLADASPLESLKEVLERAGAGRGSVDLVLRLDDLSREVVVTLPARYALSVEVCAALRAVNGVIDAREG